MPSSSASASTSGWTRSIRQKLDVSSDLVPQIFVTRLSGYEESTAALPNEREYIRTNVLQILKRETRSASLVMSQSDSRSCSAGRGLASGAGTALFQVSPRSIRSYEYAPSEDSERTLYGRIASHESLCAGNFKGTVRKHFDSY